MTLAFLDLETTGLINPRILEVGMILADDQLVPFAERSILVDPREDTNTPIVPHWSELLEPEAFRMHTDNGLLAEIDERAPGDIEMAEEALLTWLDPFRPASEPRGTWPLVGFGVGRYDVPLLARWMPDLLGRFHYRTIDVRTLTEVTRRWADFGGAPNPTKKHRALPDCRDALDTLRWWRSRYMPDRSGAEPAAAHQTTHAITFSGVPGQLEMHVEPPVYPPAPYQGSQRDAADRNYG